MASYWLQLTSHSRIIIVLNAKETHMPVRWNAPSMIDRGLHLFNMIYRKKRLANPNHDIHNLARKVDEWLPDSVQSLITGTYTPHAGIRA